MKRTKSILLVLLAATTLNLFSCSKDTNEEKTTTDVTEKKDNKEDQNKEDNKEDNKEQPVEEIKEYTLTFVFGHNIPNTTLKLKKGDQITYPEVPFVYKYKFVGWDNDLKYMPENDLTITAKYEEATKRKVTFVLNNGDENIVKEYYYTDTIEYPDNPTNPNGKVFAGWDKDITKMPDENVTITALWKNAETSIVTVDMNGGINDFYPNNMSRYTLEGKIGDPINYGGNRNNYKKANHTFKGWDPDLKTFPEYDVTVYAQWIEDTKYTLTFVLNNGHNDIVSQLYKDQEVTYPSDPTREGYRFLGWDNPNITKMPDENVTITALWEEEGKRALKFIFGNGDQDANYSLSPNETITYPDTSNLKRMNYLFDGWDSSYTKMPDKDLIIRAKWKYNVTPGAYTYNDLQTENPTPRVSFEEACFSNFSIDENGLLNRTSTSNLPSVVTSTRQYILVFPDTVKSLSSDVFASLNNVVGVDLRATQITSLPSGTFKNNYAEGRQTGPGSYTGRNYTGANQFYLPSTLESVTNDVFGGVNPSLIINLDTDLEKASALKTQFVSNTSVSTGKISFFYCKDGTTYTIVT